jgi:hypothetical protein
MIPVPADKLCVTEGEARPGHDGAFSVDTAKMRAYVNGWTSQAVEARFTYLGPTEETSKLGSGEVREQFGLKLRAQNACNLVYAMWRFTPQSRVVVSVKSNPGQSTSAECGNDGYTNLKAAHSAPLPPVNKGGKHELSAEIEGNELKVVADGKLVWAGDLGPVAEPMKGPVGIRSDNVRLALELRAGAPKGIHPMYMTACKTGPDASD